MSRQYHANEGPSPNPVMAKGGDLTAGFNVVI